MRVMIAVLLHYIRSFELLKLCLFFPPPIGLFTRRSHVLYKSVQLFFLSIFADFENLHGSELHPSYLNLKRRGYFFTSRGRIDRFKKRREKIFFGWCCDRLRLHQPRRFLSRFFATPVGGWMGERGEGRKGTMNRVILERMQVGRK